MILLHMQSEHIVLALRGVEEYMALVHDHHVGGATDASVGGWLPCTV